MERGAPRLMLSTAILVLSIGLLILAIAAIWMLALAFQRHPLWGLLFPFAAPFLLIYAWPRAKWPFFLGLLGVAVCVFGVTEMPQAEMDRIAALRAENGETDSSQDSKSALPESAPSKRAETEPEVKLAALRSREADLLRRKAELPPGDQAAAAALTQEINHYNAELQLLLQRIGKQPAPASTP